MSDEVVTTRRGNSEINSEPITTLDVFRPSRQMKQIKALFYSKVLPGTDLSKLTAEQISEYAPHRSLVNWVTNPDFMSWFKGASDYRQKIDYLLARQLDNLEDIIENEADAFSTGDILKAGKQLIELRAEISKDADQPKEVTEDMLRKATQEAMERIKAKREVKLAPAVKLPD